MSKPAQTPPSFPALVQSYFAEYLPQQRALSPRTVAAYRDALVLFLEFAQGQLGKAPVAMILGEFTPKLIGAFLNHLEQQRHNCVRSRNARLAALRSFLKFAGVVSNTNPRFTGSFGSVYFTGEPGWMVT